MNAFFVDFNVFQGQKYQCARKIQYFEIFGQFLAIVYSVWRRVITSERKSSNLKYDFYGLFRPISLSSND